MSRSPTTVTHVLVTEILGGIQCRVKDQDARGARIALHERMVVTPPIISAGCRLRLTAPRAYEPQIGTDRQFEQVGSQEAR